MTLGEYARELINPFRSNSDFKTIVDHIPRTSSSSGTDGGYSIPTFTTGSVNSVNVLITEYVKEERSDEKLGELDNGDLVSIFDSGLSIGTDDLIRHSSGTFSIKTINPVFLAGTSAAQQIILTKKA